MRHSRSHFMLAATVIGLAFATMASAQGPVRPRPRDAAGSAPGLQGDGARQGRGQSRPDGVRGARRGNVAAMLLGLRGPLALTDDQVTRLEALAAAGAPASKASDMLRVRADLMDAMQGDGNLTSARTALDKMSRLKNDRVIAGLKQRQEARAVLTAAQRSTLDNLRQASRDRGGRGGRGARGGRAGRGPEGPPAQGFARPGRPGMPPAGPAMGGRRPMPPVPPAADDQG